MGNVYYFCVALTILALGVSLIGAYRYLISIVRNGTKPRISSWIAWEVSWLVLIVTSMHSASFIATIFAITGAIRSLAVLVVSLKCHKAKLAFDSQDLLCLALSCACMALLVIRPNQLAANAALAALANAIATWPTVRQAWQKPRLDSHHVYTANSLVCIITAVSIFAGNTATLTTMIGPTVSFVGNICVLVILSAKRSRPAIKLQSYEAKVILGD